jgi:hydroxymethylpyrimidine pyrophosphatase-like HAD family hydrolase
MARPRPTSCWRAMVALGDPLIDRIRGGADGRETQDFLGAGGRGRHDKVAKIVGVSDDLDRVRRCQTDAQAAFGHRATANRSQPYYLDVTHKDANKGAVVGYLSHHMGVPAEEVATIGDQPNDVTMFRRSGLSIAMGNASDQVKSQADVTTDSYNDEGFAKAIERFVLPSVG